LVAQVNEIDLAKHCEILDHTADAGLLGRADSLGELFEALAEALAGLVCPREQVAPSRRRKIAVQAEDVEALLVDFLNKVLWTIQTEHFMIAAVRATACDETAVVVELAGEPYEPGRHELTGEIKAVTYHKLKVAREGAGWVGRVIVDM